jgi:hypothetical protein
MASLKSTLMVVGGLTMTALFVPFTLSHGATSYNENRYLLGQGMHFWGALLGVVPNVLIGVGFWRLRERVAVGRRLTRAACTAMVGALLLPAAVDLATWGLGPPLLLPILALAAAVAALTARGHAETRVTRALGGLAAVLITGLAVGLIPMQTSDSFGGYRIFGLLAHAAAGLMWAWLGIRLGADDARLHAPQPVT